MIRIALLFLFAPAIAVQAYAQDPQTVPGARVASVAAEPREPELGVPFDLVVTFRVAGGHAAAIGDSLPAADATESVAPARITATPAAADSLDVRIVYPMVGFGAGRLGLPALPVHIRVVDGPAVAGLASERPELVRTGQRYEIPLGALVFAQHAGLLEEGVAQLPRPPADVLGGEWSVWFLLAMGLVTAAGAGGARRAIGGLRGLLRRLTGPGRGESPRARALRELERVRALDWHRNGRVDDFYEASTAALRTFASESRPLMPLALTSSELLRALAGRPGDPPVATIEAAIHRAERVKFGHERPGPEVAETDWSAVRDWVRKAPER